MSTCFIYVVQKLESIYSLGLLCWLYIKVSFGGPSWAYLNLLGMITPIMKGICCGYDKCHYTSNHNYPKGWRNFQHKLKTYINRVVYFWLPLLFVFFCFFNKLLLWCTFNLLTPSCGIHVLKVTHFLIHFNFMCNYIASWEDGTKSRSATLCLWYGLKT